MSEKGKRRRKRNEGKLVDGREKIKNKTGR